MSDKTSHRTRRRRADHGAGRLLALLLLTLLLLAPSAGAQEEAGSPIFIDRVDVNVVNVEVFVTDKSGQRVAGLTREDFEILQDGQSVDISNFYAVAREERVLEGLERDRAMLAERPLPRPERRQLPEDQRLHLVVYVDHFNIRPANRKRVLDDLEGFLEDRMGRGDQVMLLGYNRTVEVVQPFTQDRWQVQQGLKKLSKAASYRQMDDAQRRRTMGWMQNAAAESDLSTAYTHLRSYVQAARVDLRHSTGAVANVVRAMAGLPGRKAVLYVSDGLPKRPGEELYQYLLDLFGATAFNDLASETGFIDPSSESLREDETQLFNAITREANAHQVTFYTLDARGSAGGASSSAAFGALGTTAGAGIMDNLRTFNLQEPLVEMAEATGGASILNSFNFDEVLTDVARDFDSFYSLGFRSPHGGDGDYHKIEVRVNRPGLKVRHRTGFVDKPQEERVADRTLSSLLLDLTKNPLKIAVEFGQPEKGSGRGYLLPIMVRVPIAEVTLLPNGAAEQGRLRFYIVVSDENGGVSDLHSAPYPVTIASEEIETARAQEIGYAVKLRVRGGTPKVAVGVWDELSGLESFIHKTTLVGKQSFKLGDASGRR